MVELNSDEAGHHLPGKNTLAHWGLFALKKYEESHSPGISVPDLYDRVNAVFDDESQLSGAISRLFRDYKLVHRDPENWPHIYRLVWDGPGRELVEDAPRPDHLPTSSGPGKELSGPELPTPADEWDPDPPTTPERWETGYLGHTGSRDWAPASDDNDTGVASDDNDWHDHDTDAAYTCGECGEGFEEGSEYGTHVAVYHNGRDGEKYVCRECGDDFDTAQGHGGHVGNAAGHSGTQTFNFDQSIEDPETDEDEAEADASDTPTGPDPTEAEPFPGASDIVSKFFPADTTQRPQQDDYPELGGGEVMAGGPNAPEENTEAHWMVHFLREYAKDNPDDPWLMAKEIRDGDQSMFNMTRHISRILTDLRCDYRLVEKESRPGYNPWFWRLNPDDKAQQVIDAMTFPPDYKPNEIPEEPEPVEPIGTDDPDEPETADGTIDWLDVADEPNASDGSAEQESPSEPVTISSGDGPFEDDSDHEVTGTVDLSPNWPGLSCQLFHVAANDSTDPSVRYMAQRYAKKALLEEIPPSEASGPVMEILYHNRQSWKGTYDEAEVEEFERLHEHVQRLKGQSSSFTLRDLDTFLREVERANESR